MSAAGLSVRGPVVQGGGLPAPVLPAPRLPRAGRRGPSRRGWRPVALAISLLLHLAAGWWLLFGLPQKPVEEPAGPSAVDVVFDGGEAQGVPAPPGDAPAPPEPPGEAAPPPPPPSVPLPPVAVAPPPPAPLPLPSPPAPALPPPPAPPLAPPLAQAPAPPLPAPPAAAPAAPPVPPVARNLPLPPLPAQQAPSDFALPPPPPPAEAAREEEVAALPLPPPPAPEPPAAPAETAPRPPVPQRPQPQAQPRPRPAAPANPFAGAMDLGSGIVVGRPAPPPGSISRPGREAGAAGAANADAPNAQMRIRGANLGADWRAAFMAWLRAHGYYPRQAVEAGEDGTAVVRFTVARDGRVSGLQLIGRSGSIWLDAGAQALLRDRVVPPFPPGTTENSAEIDLTINYILRRR